MPTSHLMHFAGRPLRIYQFFNGQLWFDCRDVAKVLGYPDALEAMRAHCNRNGIHLGSGDRPTMLIDLPNMMRLLIGSSSEHAERFEEWLRHDCLNRFFCRLLLPSEGQVTVDAQPLIRLCWRDQYWVKLSDVAEALGPRLRLGRPS
ncbi:hypothetical protein NS2R_19905 [Pseudomonas oryzihabitans]|nr:hypothetical protein NS2R_19905 [Pseudomonas psychrotolerans]